MKVRHIADFKKPIIQLVHSVTVYFHVPAVTVWWGQGDTPWNIFCVISCWYRCSVPEVVIVSRSSTARITAVGLNYWVRCCCTIPQNCSARVTMWIFGLSILSKLLCYLSTRHIFLSVPHSASHHHCSILPVSRQSPPLRNYKNITIAGIFCWDACKYNFMIWY